MSVKWTNLRNGDLTTLLPCKLTNFKFRLTFTTTPVGLCLSITQLAVLLMLCPPGPLPSINCSSSSFYETKKKKIQFMFLQHLYIGLVRVDVDLSVLTSTRGGYGFTHFFQRTGWMLVIVLQINGPFGFSITIVQSLVLASSIFLAITTLPIDLIWSK